MEKCEKCGREVQNEIDMLITSDGNWICHRCVVDHYEEVMGKMTKAFVDMSILFQRAESVMEHWKDVFSELPEEIQASIKEFDEQFN